ncbi:MAG: MarR family transcriptional regulator [Chloroflexota bacterium]|nr:MarR family transcriptional regulator [Chloroflexota bacterium]
MIKIMYSTDTATGGRPALPEGGHEQEILRDTAVLMTRVMPQVTRNIKHHARSTEIPGLEKELGDSQALVLLSLRVGSQLTSELARRYNVTNPTMTRVIDGLVDKGYVERRHDVEDRRCIILQLTPAGEEQARRIKEAFQASMTRFLSPLTEEQLRDLRVALSHLEGLLQDGGLEGSPCPMDLQIETQNVGDIQAQTYYSITRRTKNNG